MLKLKKNPVGIILFDFYMEELRNVKLDLRIWLKPAIEHTLDDYFVEVVPMLKTDTKRKRGHLCFKAEELRKTKTDFFHIENIPFEDATYKGLLLGVLQIKVKSRKRKTKYTLMNSNTKLNFNFLTLEKKGP